MLRKRDYEIIINADNHDFTMWELYREGAKVIANKEELVLVYKMLSELRESVGDVLRSNGYAI